MILYLGSTRRRHEVLVITLLSTMLNSTRAHIKVQTVFTEACAHGVPVLAQRPGPTVMWPSLLVCVFVCVLRDFADALGPAPLAGPAATRPGEPFALKSPSTPTLTSSRWLWVSELKSLRCGEKESNVSAFVQEPRNRSQLTKVQCASEPTRTSLWSG